MLFYYNLQTLGPGLGVKPSLRSLFLWEDLFLNRQDDLIPHETKGYTQDKALEELKELKNTFINPDYFKLGWKGKNNLAGNSGERGQKLRPAVLSM